MATDTISKWIEIVNSPDDGGWYVQQNRKDGSYRVSVETYKTYRDARRAHLYGDVTWGPWQ